jgi:hypothetical protein
VRHRVRIIQAARDELIRQAAQDEVLHNDDTSMRVLRMARDPSDDRTGVFTTGIVSTQQGRRIALYFTGRQHAGENLRDVLQHRTADLAPPLQMCDALSRNTPKLSDGAEILLAHCLAHGRRQFVKWPRTSRNPAVMFSKRWAKSINMMRKRASTIYRQPSASRFISSTAAR